jgi:hypothetical protein
MEDVLDRYEEEYDPQSPTVWLDEKPVVLHADVQPSVPVEPGKPERIDYEYERRGTRNLFVVVEPRAGWRHVEVTEQRTMQDYAKIVRWLVEEVYPHAEYIRLPRFTKPSRLPKPVATTSGAVLPGSSPHVMLVSSWSGCIQSRNPHRTDQQIRCTCLWQTPGPPA